MSFDKLFFFVGHVASHWLKKYYRYQLNCNHNWSDLWVRIYYNVCNICQILVFFSQKNFFAVKSILDDAVWSCRQRTYASQLVSSTIFHSITHRMNMRTIYRNRQPPMLYKTILLSIINFYVMALIKWQHACESMKIGIFIHFFRCCFARVLKHSHKNLSIPLKFNQWATICTRSCFSQSVCVRVC